MICNTCRQDYQPSEAELKLMRAKWSEAKATIELLAPILDRIDPFEYLRRNQVDVKQQNR